MKDEFKLIEQATELFKLQKEQDQCIGLLYPAAEAGVYPYRRPALAVYARVTVVGNTGDFFACIRSIDDSGVSIFGTMEPLEKARGRYVAFVEFIESLEYACPTKEQLREFCQNNGVGEDYW